MREYNVAIVGATGLVGKEIIAILEQRDFPVNELRLLAPEPPVGLELSYKGEELVVQKLTETLFAGIDIALFASEATVSKKFAPFAVKAGTVVIDTTRAFRMEPDVPLVIPEVNPHIIGSHKGIIASPDCATIPLVVVLKPIHTAAKIKRIVVSTYQAVSETGQEAIEELDRQVRSIFNHRDVVCQVFPYQIAFNCLPQIGAFLENDYTQTEMNIVQETQKILGNGSMKITATAVWVPVFYGHSVSVNLETEKKITPVEVHYLLDETPGVKVVDEPQKNLYPLAIEAIGEDETLVGRIREDESLENGINLWIVTDNLRKGAALNAVQIAEILIWGGE
jgi:aspartate-semialdehyde dehydrogenase